MQKAEQVDFRIIVQQESDPTKVSIGLLNHSPIKLADSTEMLTAWIKKLCEGGAQSLGIFS